jgi:hypothetical protein
LDFCPPLFHFGVVSAADPKSLPSDVIASISHLRQISRPKVQLGRNELPKSGKTGAKT